MRTIVFWGLYWGPLMLGNYYIFLLMGILELLYRAICV